MDTVEVKKKLHVAILLTAISQISFIDDSAAQDDVIKSLIEKKLIDVTIAYDRERGGTKTEFYSE